MKALPFLAALVVLAARPVAAGDCLDPLETNPAWSCHADLSNGSAVDYCLQHTNTFGDDPATKFFKLKSTGPAVTNCTCGAKGKVLNASYGESKTFLCLDRATDTAVSGKISNKKLAGQTFVASSGVRTTFACKPDPTCTVQAIVDPDLPSEEGLLELPTQPSETSKNVVAAGPIDVGYLGGCSGYASEAPTLELHLASTLALTLLIGFDYLGAEENAAGMLVVTPSGEARCGPNGVILPAQMGSYRVWLPSTVPGDTVEAEVIASLFE